MSTDNYIPYGPEWVKEVMKLPKAKIIDLYKNSRLEIKRLESGGAMAEAWIDVRGGRLPYNKEEGLCTNGTTVWPFVYSDYTNTFDRHSGHPHEMDRVIVYAYDKVTHWMPLPKPPKSALGEDKPSKT